MKQYKLIKLSSGTNIYLATSDEYLVKVVLEEYCCSNCIKEAKENKSGCTEDDIYNLLGTSCGAEFWLDEVKALS